MKRIIFDIETLPFSEAFKNASTQRLRTKLAPEMRIACAFDEQRNVYRYFTPRNVSSLIRLLQSADEIVSFNGKCFDILLLRRHYGLKGRIPLTGKHIDIHEIMTARAGFRVSLKAAVNHNFGESKHTGGREMAELNNEQLKLACQSDVSQTYRLHQCYLKGSLLSPPRRQWKRKDEEDCGELGNIPRECVSCGSVGSLEPIDWETEDMSDGQLSDYLGGMCGTAQCQKCQEFTDWGF